MISLTASIAMPDDGFGREPPCSPSNHTPIEATKTCRTASVKLQFARSITLQNNISSPRKGFTMRHCLLAVLALLALAFTQGVGQNKSEKPSLDGAKVFIEPMQGDLHPFIAAEIVKKKLPFVIVMERKNADYILAWSFTKGDDNKNQGSVQLLNVPDTTLVWAGEAGDRSMFFGGMSRCAQSKVADRIINKMKNDLFSFQRTDADHTQRNNLSGRRPPNRGGQAARDGADSSIVDPAIARPP